MDWDEKEVRLYADDILLNRTPLDNTVNASYKEVANPFRQPHFIILNLALGATGGDLDKLPLPQKYEIDYVRIYQKKDSPIKEPFHTARKSNRPLPETGKRAGIAA